MQGLSRRSLDSMSSTTCITMRAVPTLSCLTAPFNLVLRRSSYAMIQTTADSGVGARFGDFESRVYGVGPILTYVLGSNPVTALTLVAKWYHELGAENTLEDDTVSAEASFKF